MRLTITTLILLCLSYKIHSQGLKCNVPADIMFLMDGSDSVRDDDWYKAKNFVSKMIEMFDIGQDAIHVGMVVYSTTVGEHLGLQPYRNKFLLKSLAQALSHPREISTNTAGGIEKVREIFKAQSRLGAPKIMIVVTDGSSDEPIQTALQAGLAKAEGIKVIAVGVGDHVFLKELQQIASKQSKVYTSPDFSTLMGLAGEIRNMVCEAISTTTMMPSIPTVPPRRIPIADGRVCNVPGDIVFLMDGSDSIGDDDFMRQKMFVANLIDNFEIGTSAIHVGMVVFSTLIGDVVGLQPPKNKELLKVLAQRLRHPMVGTNTARGLDRVRKMIRDEGRPNAPKIIVVITDGRSVSPQDTANEASLAKAEGVTLISVGVGTQIFRDELRQIASSERKVFEVADFRALELIVSAMRNLICHDVLISTTTTAAPTLPPTPVSPPSGLICDVPADIVFLLDGSDSITNEDWSRQRNFAANLINNLEISPNAMHASVIVFSTLIGDIIDLTPFKPKQVLMFMTRVLKQPKVGTNTARGIKKMRELLRAQGRPNAPKVAVIVTDGRSVSPQETAAQAALAQSEGIATIAVGVGTQIFTEELSAIASSPRRLFEVTDFSALQKIVVELRNLICQAIKTTTVSTTPPMLTIPGPFPTLPPADLCRTPADIVILMDGSQSINEHDWIRMKHFVSSLIQNLEIGEDWIHSGVVVYSTFVGDTIGVKPFKTKQHLRDLTEHLIHPNDGTNTARGIEKVREIMKTQARMGVPQICIVVTDGRSTKPRDTIAQAEMAKAEGIKMIAVGVGPDVFMDELKQIASTERKVFFVQDFSALLNLIMSLRDLICMVITTTPVPITTTLVPITTTQKQTTTLEPSPHLCDGCLIDQGVGYNPYPDDCTKYVQCWQENTGVRALVRLCPFGQFWDTSVITCRLSINIICPHDPCQNTPDGFTYGMADNGCRAYWMCSGGVSIGVCCPEKTKYLEGIGCVRGLDCQGQCPPDGTIVKESCNKEVHWDNRYYVENVMRRGKLVRPCAPGTIFSKDHCACVMTMDTVLPIHPDEQCKPSAYYTFDKNFMDQSGNGVSVGFENVRLTKLGGASFNGNSLLNMWRFAGADWGSKIVIKFKFRFGHWNNLLDLGTTPVGDGFDIGGQWVWGWGNGNTHNVSIIGDWNGRRILNLLTKLQSLRGTQEYQMLLYQLANSRDFQILLMQLGLTPGSSNVLQIIRILTEGKGIDEMRKILRQIRTIHGKTALTRWLEQLGAHRGDASWHKWLEAYGSSLAKSGSGGGFGTGNGTGGFGTRIIGSWWDGQDGSSFWKEGLRNFLGNGDSSQIASSWDNGGSKGNQGGSVWNWDLDQTRSSWTPDQGGSWVDSFSTNGGTTGGSIDASKWSFQGVHGSKGSNKGSVWGQSRWSSTGGKQGTFVTDGGSGTSGTGTWVFGQTSVSDGTDVNGGLGIVGANSQLDGGLGHGGGSFSSSSEAGAGIFIDQQSGGHGEISQTTGGFDQGGGSLSGSSVSGGGGFIGHQLGGQISQSAGGFDLGGGSFSGSSVSGGGGFIGQQLGGQISQTTGGFDQGGGSFSGSSVSGGGGFIGQQLGGQISQSAGGLGQGGGLFSSLLESGGGGFISQQSGGHGEISQTTGGFDQGGGSLSGSSLSGGGGFIGQQLGGQISQSAGGFDQGGGSFSGSSVSGGGGFIGQQLGGQISQSAGGFDQGGGSFSGSSVSGGGGFIGQQLGGQISQSAGGLGQGGGLFSSLLESGGGGFISQQSGGHGEISQTTGGFDQGGGSLSASSVSGGGGFIGQQLGGQISQSAGGFDQGGGSFSGSSVSGGGGFIGQQLGGQISQSAGGFDQGGGSFSGSSVSGGGGFIGQQLGGQISQSAGGLGQGGGLFSSLLESGGGGFISQQSGGHGEISQTTGGFDQGGGSFSGSSVSGGGGFIGQQLGGQISQSAGGFDQGGGSFSGSSVSGGGGFIGQQLDGQISQSAGGLGHGGGSFSSSLESGGGVFISQQSGGHGEISQTTGGFDLGGGSLSGASVSGGSDFIGQQLDGQISQSAGGLGHGGGLFPSSLESGGGGFNTQQSGGNGEISQITGGFDLGGGSFSGSSVSGGGGFIGQQLGGQISQSAGGFDQGGGSFSGSSVSGGGGFIGQQLDGQISQSAGGLGHGGGSFSSSLESGGGVFISQQSGGHGEISQTTGGFDLGGGSLSGASVSGGSDFIGQQLDGQISQSAGGLGHGGGLFPSSLESGGGGFNSQQSGGNGEISQITGGFDLGGGSFSGSSVSGGGGFIGQQLDGQISQSSVGLGQGGGSFSSLLESGGGGFISQQSGGHGEISQTTGGFDQGGGSLSGSSVSGGGGFIGQQLGGQISQSAGGFDQGGGSFSGSSVSGGGGFIGQQLGGQISQSAGGFDQGGGSFSGSSVSGGGGFIGQQLDGQISQSAGGFDLGGGSFSGSSVSGGGGFIGQQLDGQISQSAGGLGQGGGSFSSLLESGGGGFIGQQSAGNGQISQTTGGFDQGGGSFSGLSEAGAEAFIRQQSSGQGQMSQLTGGLGQGGGSFSSSLDSGAGAFIGQQSGGHVQINELAGGLGQGGGSFSGLSEAGAEAFIRQQSSGQGHMSQLTGGLGQGGGSFSSSLDSGAGAFIDQQSGGHVQINQLAGGLGQGSGSFAGLSQAGAETFVGQQSSGHGQLSQLAGGLGQGGSSFSGLSEAHAGAFVGQQSDGQGQISQLTGGLGQGGGSFSSSSELDAGAFIGQESGGRGQILVNPGGFSSQEIMSATSVRDWNSVFQPKEVTVRHHQRPIIKQQLVPITIRRVLRADGTTVIQKVTGQEGEATQLVPLDVAREIQQNGFVLDDAKFGQMTRSSGGSSYGSSTSSGSYSGGASGNNKPIRVGSDQFLFDGTMGSRRVSGSGGLSNHLRHVQGRWGGLPGISKGVNMGHGILRAGSVAMDMSGRFPGLNPLMTPMERPSGSLGGYRKKRDTSGILPSQNIQPITNKNKWQALVSNCQGRNGQGPSIMIVANDGDIKFSIKTYSMKNSKEITVPLVPGWNEVTMVYDGTKMTGLVQNWKGLQKKSIMATGNIERRQAGLLVGSCQGLESFVGEMDDLVINPCS